MQQAFRISDWRVEPQLNTLTGPDKTAHLEPKVMQVLLCLAEQAGQVIPKERLLRHVWPDTFVSDDVLTRSISELRRAFGDDAKEPRFIQTIPRGGYRLIAEVSQIDPQEGRPSTPREMPSLQEASPGEAVTPRVIEDLPIIPDVHRQRTKPVLWSAWATAIAVMAIAGFGYWRPWRAAPVPANRPVAQLDLDVGPDGFSQPAISSDGMRIVFVSKGMLALRRVEHATMTRLPGTEGASYPFLSPNGKWVAFFAAGKLQKIDLEGGAPIVLCDAAGPGGGSWGDDDNIVAALDARQGLFRVSAAGGAPQRLTDSKSDPSATQMHLWPQILPSGKGVLFAAVNGSSQGSIHFFNRRTGQIKRIIRNSTHARYLATGHVVYNQQGTLYAVPVDADQLEPAGPPVSLVNATSYVPDRGDFDLSASGTLIYRQATENETLPSWFYSSGKIEPALVKPGNYRSANLSPDGTRVAISLIQQGRQSLWVYDLRRETLNRLTSEDDEEWLPTWTPDGEFLAFRSGNNLAWKRVDGSGKVEHLPGVSRNAGPWSFSADGKWVAFWPLEPGSDLWIVPVERTPGVMRLSQPQPLLQHDGTNGAPAISPDGRWVAYTSNVTGSFEIYVMPFSPQSRATGRKWLVSNHGGHTPRWSHAGRELFYAGPNRRIQVAAYQVRGDSFVPEKPRFWSDKQVADTGPFPGFDVAPDGKRVLALFSAENPKPETILRVMLNVDSELKRRAPPTRN